MRIAFLGPSGAGLSRRAFEDRIRFAGPARMGDVAAAVLAGADAIGLIDGTFGDHAAVWHKEILFALSQGVAVLGGASMGALRAAECAPFGMVGIGTVFEGFADGRIVDDADVALIHGPEELGWAPLSEAMVNVEATLAGLAADGAISGAEAARLRSSGAALFFADRTFPAIAKAAISDPTRRGEITGLLRARRRDVKAEDTERLLHHLAGLDAARQGPPSGWTFAETLDWQALLRSVRARPKIPS